MNRIIPIAAAALAAGTLAACGSTTTTTTSDSSNAANTSTTAPAATPHPAATADSNSDLLLASSIGGQNYFVGAANITNTGNVGVAVLVTIRFAQVSSADIADLKTVRIPYRASRTVKFRIPVTSSQVDELQASPSYANDGVAGKIRTSIVDTFGKAH